MWLLSNRRFRSGAVSVLLTGLLVATGCYKYVPVQLTAVDTTADVRVRVTESAAARLVRDLGTYSTEIEGRVAPEAQDSVSVSVTINRTYRGLLVESGRHTMFLGRSEVLDIHRKELSRGRSVVAGVGAVAVGVLLITSVVQWLDPNPPTDGEPPPPPEPSLLGLRLLRIPIR